MAVLYSHGLPFSEIVAKNINDLIKRIDTNKASCIIIDGQMGEGKTTLAVECGEYTEMVYNQSINTKNFYKYNDIILKNQLGMGGDDFQEKLQICKDNKHRVIIYDEAGDFSRRGAITQFNQRLNRVFQTFRTFRVLIILCLPCFDILDNDFFKIGVPRLLLNCHNRGESQGDIRGYGLEEMFYLKHYMKKEVVPLKVYQKVTPNFRGHFLNLPESYCAEVDRVSTKAKEETLSSNILKSRGLITRKQIAQKLHITEGAVLKRLLKIKIEPSTQYKKTNYYDESTLLMVKEAVRQK